MSKEQHVFEFDNFTFWIDKTAIPSTLFMAVSGSHSFGWNTGHSDLDIRMVWIPDLAQAVSPFYKGKTRHYFMYDGTIDITEFPLQTFVSLLEKGNGNCIENLFQFKLHQDVELVKSLQDIVLENLHRGILHHYLGYCNSLMKDLANSSRVTHYGKVKLLLNLYRCALLGISVERDRIIEPNLRYLLKKNYTSNQLFADVLLEANAGNEHLVKVIDNLDFRKIEREAMALKNELTLTIEHSKLPEHGFSEVPLDRFVVDLYKHKVAE